MQTNRFLAILLLIPALACSLTTTLAAAVMGERPDEALTAAIVNRLPALASEPLNPYPLIIPCLSSLFIAGKEMGTIRAEGDMRVAFGGCSTPKDTKSTNHKLLGGLK